MSKSPASPYLTAEHEAFRDQVRRFVSNEIEPHIHDWDEAGRVPREFVNKVAEAGLLQLGYPEELGGVPVPDNQYHIVFHEELTRAGSGGILPAVWIHGIALPPIVAFGSDAQKEKFVKPVLSGEKMAALAVTAWQSGLMGGARGTQEPTVAAIPADLTTFVFAAPDATDVDPATISARTVPEVEDLLRGLEVVELTERSERGPAFSGPKHWHVFTVLARARR